LLLRPLGNFGGGELNGLSVLPPSAMLEEYPDKEHSLVEVPAGDNTAVAIIKN